MMKKYASFSNYLYDVYYNEIFQKLHAFINQNREHLDLTTNHVPYPAYVELDDFSIKSVTFHESNNDRIQFKTTINATVNILGRYKKDYDSDTKILWLSVSFNGTLNNGLHKVKIINIEPYSKESFQKEKALSKYLIPYMYASDLDKYATEFLEKYYPDALKVPMPLSINDIIRKMGLTVYSAPLPDNIFGRTYFNSAIVEVYDNGVESKKTKTNINAGTILINPNVFFMRNIGSINNTIIHECVHWDRHHNFFELQKILKPEVAMISCGVVNDHASQKGNFDDPISWMEWQANALAPRILIPAKMGRLKLSQLLTEMHISYPDRGNAEIMEAAIHDFADFFQVSIMAAKIRATDLGFEQAIGAYNYINGKKYPPFSFSRGSLKKNQTFMIDCKNLMFQVLTNQTLANIMKKGRFLHVQGAVVINAPKYVNVILGQQATLTEYALNHMDECCLVFDRTIRVSKAYDDSFYRICFLSRDVDPICFVEAKYNPNEGQNENVSKRAANMKTISTETDRILNSFDEIPSTFAATLKYHIHRRKITLETLEGRSGISVRTLSDYINKKNINPTIESTLALCIGLNLHPIYAYDLISKSKYNIDAPSKENFIFKYLINEHHMETVILWNERLRELGLNIQLPRKGCKETLPPS